MILQVKRKVMLASLGLVTSLCLATQPATRPRALGTIVGWGHLEVDSLPAPPGTTLFAQDVVKTGPRSGAILRLLSGESATLAGDSEVLVTSRAALELRHGGLQVAGGSGALGEIRLPGATLTWGSQTPALCRVAAVGTSSAIQVERGRVTIRGAGAPLLVASGTTVWLEDGVERAGKQTAGAASPQALSLPSVGRVVKLYRRGVIQHAGSRLAVSLRLGELISQDDEVRTLATGRVRIELLGGSFVTLGAASSMKVIRHEPVRHETQIELQSGRLHAEVAPASQVSFEVRTPSAAVRVTATTVVIEARTKLTAVCDAGPGKVLVRGLVASQAGEVTLRQDECVSVRYESGPGQVRQAEARVRKEMALTGFEGLPTIEHQAKVLAIHKGTVGADVLAAILAGIGYGVVNSAVNHIGDTTSALTNAANQFGSAAAGFNGAVSAARTASAAGAALCHGIEALALDLGVHPSPSAPAGFNCPP